MSVWAPAMAVSNGKGIDLLENARRPAPQFRRGAREKDPARDQGEDVGRTDQGGVHVMGGP